MTETIKQKDKKTRVSKTKQVYMNAILIDIDDLTDTDSGLYEVHCNLFSAYKFLKKFDYKLVTKAEDPEFKHIDYSYNLFELKALKNIHDNELILSEKSYFGDYKLMFKKDGLTILFVCGAKCKLLCDADILPYEYNQDNVYLDIETTGLNIFDSEIISLALYQPATKKETQIYLPLKRSKGIPKYITELTGISNYSIEKSSDLTQEQFDEIVQNFELTKNKIVIWAGQNLFDVVFLAAYFLDNNLQGFDKLCFMNAKNEAAKKIKNDSYSKDSIAMLYKIDISNAHRAISDCKIQQEICENLNKNNIPEKPDIEKIKKEIASKFFKLTRDESIAYYDKLCEYCFMTYGFVDKDYDDNPTKRGIYDIDIHHIDELTLDNIGVRTQNALTEHNEKELKYLKKYNKRDRLVYVSRELHFWLHILIERIRPGIGGGPHFLYQYVFDKVNFDRMSPESRVYVKLLKYESIPFDYGESFWNQDNLDKNLLQKVLNNLEKDYNKCIIDEDNLKKF